MRGIITFIVCVLTVNFGYGQILTFDFGGNVGDEVSVISNSNDANLSTSSITRGSGLVASNQADRFNARSWSLNDMATAIAENSYMEFTVAPNSGYQFDVTTIAVEFQRSATGPSEISLRSSIDGYATNIDGLKAIANLVNTSETITFTVNQANSATAVTFRIYGWAQGVLGNGGFEGAGDDIIVNGTVTALGTCVGTTTWDGATWSAGIPDLTTNAIIDGSYNTATDGGSFSACSLTVNSSGVAPEYTLTIDNGDYVEVRGNILANGDISVLSQGTLLQLDDAATVTGTGTMQVTKTKNMFNATTYTYWSSPVTDESIESTFFATPTDRRFEFEAVNFVDLLEEVGNTGTFLNNPGVDDIDDDGNDWQLFSTGIMIPGVGYATMPSPIVGPGGFPEDRSYIFNGEFNNGVITVPLVNNSGGAYNDWNFIGNPYPSAISTDIFFAVNTGLVDVIFLWDQATPPDSNNSGSQNSNFSVDDYAMINGTGGTGARGGTGNIPNKFIPSGQGFFVEALAAGNVTFNNSMRVKGITDNSQFFRMSSSKKTAAIDNKLWLDLKSDNGAFNQILIGYIKDATNAYDGSFYDAKRNLSSGNPVTLYSTIGNDSGKYAIQGKAENSLNEDEVISLGYKTSIEVPTIYSISIAQLEGGFLTNNTVYLKDNLLNKLHNLKVSDYNFTSNVGEFNDRFEIVFSQDALSLNEQLIGSNQLSIIEHANGDVQFKLNASNSMTNIKIIDLQGRMLYNYDVSSNDETLSLSNLSSAPYIAKVTLDNNAVINKKAVKKY